MRIQFSIRICCFFLGLALLTGCAVTHSGNAQTPATDSSVARAETKAEQPLPGMCLDQMLATDREAEVNLWQRIRSQFSLPVSNHPRVDSQRKWYLSHPAYMQRVSKRAEPYLYDIVVELEKRNMPLELALLPIVESAFDPFAYSHGRASGIWQFIPGTAKRFGLRMDWWYDGRRDIYLATRAALDYLQYLHKRFDGNWYYALAAYNSGEGNVRKAIRHNRRKGRATDFFSLDLPKETEAYVPKLIALAQILSAPEHFALWQPIANRPYFERVEIDSQIDLTLAAELAGIDMQTFYLLNPAFNQWATSPKGPHALLLPVGKKAQFIAALATVPVNERIAFKRYRVRSGDSLLKIAKRFNTQVSLLKKANGIRGSSIRAGDALLIPTAFKSQNAYVKSARQRLLTQQNINRGGVKQTIYVQPGDSFWSLARKYGVNMRSLAKWNNMAPTDPLRVGQKLVVWQKQAQKLAMLDGQKRTRKIYYRVRNGDSLAKIAAKFNVNLTSIKRWNRHVSAKKYLQPGDSLVLYVDIRNQY